MLGEGTTEREKRELTTSVRRRQTTNIHPDAQEMMQAANGLPHKQRKVIRYQDLMHLLPPLCPGRIVQVRVCSLCFSFSDSSRNNRSADRSVTRPAHLVSSKTISSTTLAIKTVSSIYSRRAVSV